MLEWRKKKKKRTDEMKNAETPRETVQEKEQLTVKKSKMGKRLRLLFWLVLLIIVGYLAVQVGMILAPQMRTAVLVEDEMIDALQVEGFVCMESEPVYSEGIMYYTVPTGQRVSEGDELALVYADSAGVLAREELSGIEEEMYLLQEVQETAVQTGDVDAILRESEEGLYAYLDVLASGDFDQIAEPRNELSVANNRLQLATGDETDYTARMQTLQAQAAELESAAAPQSAVTAPKSGYFVPSGQQDRVPMEYESLVAQTPQQLQEAMQGEADFFEESVVGHLATDYQWYFFTVIPLAEVDKFTQGQKLELRFTDVSEENMDVRVQAVEVDEEAQLAKVELMCEEVNEDILNLRLEEAEIIFSTETGLRMEKKALRVIEGQTCVYELFGNQVMLRPVEVLVDGEEYVLLSDQYETDVNEIELYDEIVVDSGGTELYDQRII